MLWFVELGFHELPKFGQIKVVQRAGGGQEPIVIISKVLLLENLLVPYPPLGYLQCCVNHNSLYSLVNHQSACLL